MSTVMITLPGYTIKVNNSVYVAETTDPSVRSIITLKQFREFVFEDVLDYVKKNAVSWKEQLDLGCQPVRDLERALAKLPKKYLAGFLNGSEDFDKSMAPYFFANTLKNPSRYIDITHGFLPEEEISGIQNGELEYYETRILDLDLTNQGLGYQWSTLLERVNGFLPAQDNVLDAISKGKSKSDIISIDPEIFPIGEVIKIMNSCYEGLTPGNMDCIEDVSEEILEMLALDSLDKLSRNLAEEDKPGPTNLFPEFVNPN